MENFYGKSILEETEKAQQMVNKYYDRWLDNYLLYGPRKITFIDKIRFFIFRWTLRFENAWNALRGRDNW